MSLNIEPFARYLHTELELTTALHQLLVQELDVLKQQQLEELKALQPQKQQLLQDIQACAEQRLGWMTEHQLPHSPDCLEHPDIVNSGEIQPLWQQLASQYDANRHLSETLSDLVLKARYRTQQKLQILRGGNNDPHLYNEHGKTKGVNSGQGYVQA
ncbi:hypothetical protein CHH28_19000 [Bacterioplanes sanyensis]|uniref:Flagellar biosynthesis protein FlgN n=1 Tax=Bacterioplanes sanyensis TaxID=1249553 RepID=A0A222FQ28_9GAMM|nr:flagellar export chaperone FlgN [Bacterioplanes sanyensis]ASP40626.1 hypothetical protein CHH28_19000 [Bacterioplanes sanyensis]